MYVEDNTRAKTDETYFIGVDFGGKDKTMVLVVGSYDDLGQLKLVNSFGGREAHELYSRLTKEVE